MPLISLEDQELHAMAKKANRRLRDLERYEAQAGVGKSNAQRLADFYLEDFGGRARFPEAQNTIANLDPETKAFLQNAVANFLIEETSTVRGYKQSLELYGEMEDQGMLDDLDDEEADAGLNPFDKEKAPEQYDSFWKLFDQARRQGLNKTFDYKTLKQAIGWAVRQSKGDQAILEKISEDITKLSQMKKLTRRQLIDRITRKHKAPAARKPGKVKPEQELKAEPKPRKPGRKSKR